MPISVPRGDHYYPQVNRTTGEQLCFSFMRSLPGQQHLGKQRLISIYVTSDSERRFVHKFCLESKCILYTFVLNCDRKSESKFTVHISISRSGNYDPQTHALQKPSSHRHTYIHYINMIIIFWSHTLVSLKFDILETGLSSGSRQRWKFPNQPYPLDRANLKPL